MSAVAPKMHKLLTRCYRARRTIDVWKLLTTIFATLEPLQAARALSSHELLSIISRILVENYGTTRLVAEVGSAYARAGEVLQQNDAKTTPKASKKRKRNEKTETNTIPTKRRAVDQVDELDQSNDIRLLESISTCIATLVGMTRSTNPSLDTYAREYLKSTVFTDTPRTLQFMSAYIVGLNVVIAHSDFRSSRATWRRVCCLSDIAQIWSNRSKKSHNSDVEDVVCLGKSLISESH